MKKTICVNAWIHLSFIQVYCYGARVIKFAVSLAIKCAFELNVHGQTNTY